MYYKKGDKIMGYTLACDLYEPKETTSARFAEWNELNDGSTFDAYLNKLGFVMCEDVFSIINCEGEKKNYYIPNDEQGKIQTFEY